VLASAIRSASARPLQRHRFRRLPARASAFGLSILHPNRRGINPRQLGAARWWQQAAWSASTPQSSRKSGGSQGIGFAIPANMVRLVVDSALQGGSVRRPWLGANLIEVSPDFANARASTARRARSFHTSRRKAPRPRPASRLETSSFPWTQGGARPNAFQYRFTTKGHPAK